jgi:hypothetical protein
MKNDEKKEKTKTKFLFTYIIQFSKLENKKRCRLKMVMESLENK